MRRESINEQSNKNITGGGRGRIDKSIPRKYIFTFNGGAPVVSRLRIAFTISQAQFVRARTVFAPVDSLIDVLRYANANIHVPYSGANIFRDVR